MKKILSCLLAAVLSTSASFATSVSNKTFLMPRSAGVNKAQEHAGAHWLLDFPSKDHHSFFNVSGAYQQSLNRKAVGQYFGVVPGKNTFTVGAREVPNRAANGLVTTNINSQFDIEGSNLISDSTAGLRLYNGAAITDPANQPVAGTVTFSPRSEAFGLNVNFQQNFTGALEHWYLKADLPFSFSTNTMGMAVANGMTANLHAKHYTLQDFFAGKVQIAATDIDEDGLIAATATTAAIPTQGSIPVANDLQNPLTRLKINGNRSENGLADLTLSVGRRFECGEHNDRFVSLAAHVVIPTGNKIKGEYLFEPVCGNGSHVGLGANLDAGITLWHGENMSWLLSLGTNYTYLFQANEQRFPTLKNNPLGHYYSAVQNVANAVYQPLVNFLPSTKVTPGSQLDSLAALGFKYHSFGFDAGYNMFWKEQDKVTMGVLPEVYIAPRTSILGVNAAGVDHMPLGVDASNLVTVNSFDLTSMVTPSQMTHKLFGGVSYVTEFGDHAYPLNFHVGGSYEFAQDNAALEQYGVWLKVGAAF